MKDQIGRLETALKALADPTRLRILGLLAAGEVCVCDLHDSLRLSQPKVSRHLAYLRRAGLVTARREGLWMRYRLALAVDPLVATIQQAVAHALGHVEVVKRDARRLQRQTGCCVPDAACAPTYGCCEVPPKPGASTVRPSRPAAAAIRSS